jgi:hypothetical protein
MKLELTPIQAKVLFNTVDGAADAGSCSDGCTKQELKALQSIMTKLLAMRNEWKDIKLDPG